MHTPRPRWMWLGAILGLAAVFVGAAVGLALLTEAPAGEVNPVLVLGLIALFPAVAGALVLLSAAWWRAERAFRTGRPHPRTMIEKAFLAALLLSGLVYLLLLVGIPIWGILAVVLVGITIIQPWLRRWWA